jgi:hypothetical protein
VVGSSPTANHFGSTVQCDWEGIISSSGAVEISGQDSSEVDKVIPYLADPYIQE